MRLCYNYLAITSCPANNNFLHHILSLKQSMNCQSIPHKYYTVVNPMACTSDAQSSLFKLCRLYTTFLFQLVTSGITVAKRAVVFAKQHFYLKPIFRLHTHTITMMTMTSLPDWKCVKFGLRYLITNQRKIIVAKLTHLVLCIFIAWDNNATNQSSVTPIYLAVWVSTDYYMSDIINNTA